MAEKHAAVCDRCGAEEPLTGGGLSAAFPAGWWAVVPAGARVAIVTHLCSWECVARYAVDRRAVEDRGGRG